MVQWEKRCVLLALAISLTGSAAFAHDISTDYAGEPLVHVTFDDGLSNRGTFPAQPRMVGVGGEPSSAPPQYVEGRFGQAIRFEGDRILELPVDITKELYPQVTVTGWVYLEGENTNPTGILVSNNSFLRLQLYSSQLWMTTGKHSQVQFTSQVVPKYRWVFFAGVWDSATNQGTAYVDQRVKSGDMTLDTAATPDRSVWVGAQKVSSSSILDDLRIDDLRIYPGALSAAQIRDVWSGSGISQSAAGSTSAQVSSQTTSSNIPAGPDDKRIVYDGDLSGQPITGNSEIDKSLAEGSLSYDPSDRSEGLGNEPASESTSRGSGSSSASAAGNEAQGRRVIGWRLNVNDRYETAVAGRKEDLFRELDLGSANPGLRRLGWQHDKGVPCRMRVDHSGSLDSWTKEAGTCRYVTGSKEARLSFAYVTDLAADMKSQDTLHRSIDDIAISGFALGDDGERTGESMSDSTPDSGGVFQDQSDYDEVSCKDGYVANGVIAHFKRANAGNTPVTGLQLICVKVEKLYEQ